MSAQGSVLVGSQGQRGGSPRILGGQRDSVSSQDSAHPCLSPALLEASPHHDLWEWAQEEQR